MAGNGLWNDLPWLFWFFLPSIEESWWRLNGRANCVQKVLLGPWGPTAMQSQGGKPPPSNTHWAVAPWTAQAKAPPGSGRAAHQRRACDETPLGTSVAPKRDATHLERVWLKMRELGIHSFSVWFHLPRCHLARGQNQWYHFGVGCFSLS